MKLLMFWAFALALPTMAQEDARPLQKVELNPIMKGDAKCTDFFLYTTYGGAMPPRVIYRYLKSDNKTVAHESVPFAFVEPHLDQTADPPTTRVEIRKAKDGGPDERWVVFTMTPDEFAKAAGCKCIPKAKELP